MKEKAIRLLECKVHLHFTVNSMIIHCKEEEKRRKYISKVGQAAVKVTVTIMCKISQSTHCHKSFSSQDLQHPNLWKTLYIEEREKIKSMSERNSAYGVFIAIDMT
jgi:uncharacterized protein (DUF488 family)